MNHPTALYHLNTGNQFGGDPAVGSWVAYGLGTENQNLPAFLVLPDVAYPQGGAANWSNGFLPASFQGTPLRSGGTPILDMAPPEGITPEMQRSNLDLLAAFNRARSPRTGDTTNSRPGWRATNWLFACKRRCRLCSTFLDQDTRTVRYWRQR